MTNTALPPLPADTLCQRLQQKCTRWGVYWRSSDAHGVDLTLEQAHELLRDALGVEVEIAAVEKQPQVHPVALRGEPADGSTVGVLPHPMYSDPHYTHAAQVDPGSSAGGKT
jgi:hypothetical protein